MLRKRWLKWWCIHPGTKEKELGKLEITIQAGLAGRVGSSGTELVTGAGAGTSYGIWGLESCTVLLMEDDTLTSSFGGVGIGDPGG